MAAVLPVLAVASSVGGALVTGAGQANAADYQAQVAANNAITANQNANYATRAGTIQAEQESMKGAQRQAATKAAMAANGIDVNTGSAVNVEQGGREVAQTDTETTAHNAALQAYGYRTAAVGYTAQEGLDKQTAGYDELSGDLKAGGSLLSSASSLPTGGGGGNAATVADLFAGGGSPFPSAYPTS